ncbi:MAG: adenylate/guanylate cyclase domain-containing protein [Deltaproteobacteria bacterium]
MLAAFDPGGNLSTFENKTIDTRYRFYARPTSRTNDILILDISEESIKRLEPIYGRWPWPRSVHGEVAEYLHADGAKAIGFDIIFSEHSVRQEFDSRLISELSSFVRNADIPEVRAELLRRFDSLKMETSDTDFVSAVKQAGNVFQSSVLYADENDLLLKQGTYADDNTASHIQALLSKSAIPISWNNHANVYFNATVPFSDLAAASRGIGHINFFPDRDGVGRRYYPFLFFKDKDKAFSSLPLLIAAHVKGITLDSVKVEKGKLLIGDVVPPILPDTSLFIYYQGGKITQDKTGKEIYRSFYQYIPYDYVLASKDLIETGQEPVLPKGMFKDKVVLISASASGLSDLRSTPFSPVTPGIEIHANAIDNILSNKFLQPLNGFYERVYIFFLGAVIAVICHLAGPYRGFAAMLLSVAAVTGIHWKLFEKGFILPIVSPLFVITATYLGILLLKYISEYRERSYLQTAFGHYVAPAVLEDIIRSPEKLKLGGERKYMTVLFSDVEGFTSLSEELSPEEISVILNEYLSSMIQCIMKTKGTLDKFIGDAVMAIWNAPEEQQDHAYLACDTALLMMKELGRLRKKWEEEKRPLLNVRIGINTGEMVVGNMGSREIFDYTVLGAEVNTAARLEPLNKDFGTRIIVSENTRVKAEEAHPGRFVFRRLARVVLKGRSKPLAVYELIGLRDEVDGKTLEMIEKFENALDLFMDAMFAGAKKYFQESLKITPEDGPSEAYIALCNEYEKNPPLQESSGIYFQKSK